jgi:hypothetical protein
MNKEFIPYEQALELKELGFDEPCMAAYVLGQFYFKGDNYVYGSKDIPNINAPLYQQAFRWFREKHGLYSEIFVDDDKTFGFFVSSFAEEGRCRLDRPIKRQFSTYEESELECIKFLIEIVERKPEAYS